MPEYHLLIVDDEDPIRNSFIRLLSKRGFIVEGAASGEEGLLKLREKAFDLLLVDIRMPGMSGLEMLRRAKELNPAIMALVITGYGTIDTAIEAMELGALGLIPKPVTIEKLVDSINAALERGRLREENARLRTLMPLLEFGRTLFRSIDQASTLKIALDTAIKGTAADSSCMFLVNQKRGYDIAATSGNGADATGWQRPGVLSLVERACTFGQMVSSTIDETANDSDNLLSIPVISQGRCIGAMVVERKQGRPKFSDVDSEFLSVLCGQLGVTLDNLELLEQLRAEQVRAEYLLQRVNTIEMDERKRLSSELHDGPIQYVAAAQYAVDTCKTLLSESPSAREGLLTTTLADLDKMIRQGLSGLRRILTGLRPPIPANADLYSVINDLVNRIRKDVGGECTFEVKGTPINLPSAMERNIYFLIQEAMVNARKHAHATHVGVVMNYEQLGLNISVKDDGEGFDPKHSGESHSQGHLGLALMKERAEMLGASLNISSEPGRGTTITVDIPLKAMAAN